MGDRGQIKIGGVYLYTHWGGYNIKNILQRALNKRWRWDDEEYLARIIFESMIERERGTETGYGIGTAMHGDLNHPLLEVDTKRQRVIERKTVWDYEEKIEKPLEITEWSFEDFIKQKNHPFFEEEE